MTNINFLPWRKEQITYKNRIFMFCSLLSAVLALVPVIFISSILGVDLRIKKNDIEYLNQELAQLEPRIAEIKNLEKRKKDFLEKSNILEKLQRNRNQLIFILSDLSSAIPDELFLTKVDRQDNKLLLNGRSASSNMVSVFMQKLAKCFWVKSVILNDLQVVGARAGVEDESENRIEFSVTIDVDSEKNNGN